MREFMVIVIGGFVGSITAILAGVPMAVWMLIVLMGLDLVTGLLAAGIAGEISSQASWRGMMKKGLVLCVVAGSAAIHGYLGQTLQVPLTEIVAGFYLVNEAISIMENATRAGLPVPDQLKAVLKVRK